MEENMREIKFRVWHKKDKEMLVFLSGFDYNTNILSVLQTIQEWEIYQVMQFTGLKDKNGKEIYEGDIVKYDDEEDLFEIIWSKEDAGLKIKSGNYINLIEPEYLEVIGNIYENPELLK